VESHQERHTLYRCERPWCHVRQPQWSARPRRRSWWSWGVVVVLVTMCIVSEAQERLGVDPLGRSGPPPLQLPPAQPPAPLPQPILPPLPSEPPAGAPQLPQVRVFVRGIRITGSTVFSEEDLAKVTTPYVNRELTTEDLEALRLALTRLYIDAGYINSGAVIPDQTVRDGVITMQIIEGELTAIEITGNRWFRTNYLRQRLLLDLEPPLNIAPLQQRLQFLQQDSRIARLDAELAPGVQRGESVLRLRVEETNPFKVELTFNNYQSPTVGAERGLVTLTHQNLTGHGDVMSVTYGRSQGIDLQLDASYTLPLTARDLTLNLQYRRFDFTVIEDPFAPLDVQSRSEVFSVTLRQPFYRTLRREFAVSLTVEHLYNATFLLGERFQFSPGADRGQSTVSALRGTLEWTDRTAEQVLALRSRFSGGVDALGATIHEEEDLPDSRFFAWLGQFQLARRLSDWGLQGLARLDVQLASAPLLPLEQIAVGGRYSVRGYRENQLVRDNAVIGSVEARVPVVRSVSWADVVELASFVDGGTGWNTRLPTPDPRTLYSIGLGVRWALTLTRPLPLRSEFELYWGVPLKHVKTQGGNLQDHGLHLQFVVTAF
jgi:hemolysin activation/secretion protein